MGFLSPKKKKERERGRRKKHYQDSSYFDSPALAHSSDYFSNFHINASRAYLYSSDSFGE
jgi:hypothetical protein